MKKDEWQKVEEYRRAAIVTVALSMTAVMVASTVIPLFYNHMQVVNSQMELELQFCTHRSAQLWVTYSELPFEQIQRGDFQVQQQKRGKRQTFGRNNNFWLFGRKFNSGREVADDKTVWKQVPGVWSFGRFLPDPRFGASKKVVEKVSKKTDKKLADSSKKDNVMLPLRIARQQPLTDTDSYGQCCTCHQGPAGPPGGPGEVGIDGRPGNPGDDGLDGAPAPPGSTAPPAPQCNTCPEPIPGDRGTPGRNGRRGPSGDPGRDGRDGQRGRTGRPGTDGLRGRPGRDGARGPRGPAGRLIPGLAEPGPRGDPGRDGRRGVPGSPGRDGILSRFSEGRPGQRGDPGDPGRPGGFGVPGLRGEDGPDGGRGACSHCPPARLPPGY